MSSNHPDWLPGPEPGEDPSCGGEPADLIENIREAFLYHRWVVTHPNPHLGSWGWTDG